MTATNSYVLKHQPNERKESAMTREEIIDSVKDDLFRKTSPNSKASVLIIMLTAVLPSLVLVGFLGGPFSFVREMNPLAVLLSAATGGAVGMALYHPNSEYRLLGVVPGFVLGAGIYIATILYFLNRSFMFHVEILIPCALGGAPGLALYYYLVRRKALKDANL
jgi:hypothetical protein